MEPLQFLVPLGALDAIAPYVPHVALVLVVANMITRLRAFQVHSRQAEDGDHEALGRYTPHSVTMLLLILASFLFVLVERHGGLILSMLVLGAFVADFFEFEARKVEVRNGMELERPKSAIVASAFVLLYAAYQSLFFLVAPYWNAVV